MVTYLEICGVPGRTWSLLQKPNRTWININNYNYYLFISINQLINPFWGELLLSLLTTHVSVVFLEELFQLIFTERRGETAHKYFRIATTSLATTFTGSTSRIARLRINDAIINAMWSTLAHDLYYLQYKKLKMLLFLSMKTKIFATKMQSCHHVSESATKSDNSLCLSIR